MTHYFSRSPDSGHDPRALEITFRGRSYRFDTDAGVFSKRRLDPGTQLLLETAPQFCGDVADIGCGWGPLGIILAAQNPAARFVLLDINARAVDLAAQNITANGVSNARAMVSDGLAAWPGPLNHAVSNPPVRIGKQAMYALLEGAHSRLLPGGELWIVLRKQQGAPSARQYLSGLFGICEIADRAGGYWILRAVKNGE